jgi:hypothetical protein
MGSDVEVGGGGGKILKYSAGIYLYGLGKAMKYPTHFSPCTGRHCTVASPPDAHHNHHRLGRLAGNDALIMCISSG